MNRVFLPTVSYYEGAISLAVEKYHLEIDVRISSLRRIIQSEDLTKEIRNVIQASNAYIDALIRGLNLVADTPPPADNSATKRAFGQLDLEIEKVNALLQRCSEEKEGWIETGRTPFPQKRLREALICPLSKELLLEAARLPSGITVNAYALGYFYREGRFQVLESVSKTVALLRKNPHSGGFFSEIQNEALFEKACRNSLRRDFKTIELANYWNTDNLKPLPYELLFDKVSGGLYKDPQLLPCGHTESASERFSCHTSCRKNYTRYEVSPHTLLKSFVEAYQTACRVDLLAENILHLKSLVRLGLKKGSAVKQELKQLGKEREAILKENQAAQGALERLDLKIRGLEGEKKHFLVQRQILHSQLALHKEQERLWEKKQKLISQLNLAKEQKKPYEIRLEGLNSTLNRLNRQIGLLTAERSQYNTLLFAQVYHRVVHQPELVYKRCLEIAKIRLLNSY